MPATDLIKPLLILLCLSPASALAQTDSPARWLDPANDTRNLPTDGSILFWSGDQQIAGFRNTALLSPVRQVVTGEEVMPLPRAERDFSALRYEVNGESFALADYMQHNHVGGLLVLKDGQIVLEQYGLGNDEDTQWVSFSMTKSVVSLLTGAAIADGYINSVNDPVTDYLPQLRGSAYDGVSIRNVLQMASGTDWNEDYADPASDVATSPSDMLALMQFMGEKARVAEPGERFNYNTGETNLAGAIVRAAIGNNLAAYLTQKIWQPWGMESDATWISHGPYGGELGGCCLSPVLRDWGRLALLVMNDGVLHDGSRLVPEGWIAESTEPSAGSDNYGYLWWLNGDGTFRASGIFGQGIYLSPEENLVIVVQGAWPQATGASFASHRDGFFKAVEASLSAN
ncbi:serine hydrolase domain-containing protein [Pseudohongiella sp.]|uniref:Beta-lactamase-related domain-containing protein n=1 Tax=marine sediment metagenome TaxID=412755 RepID=A0A0F9VH45_9ZZZZ|nr:serine hydrolase [Pseudohongiella sp.]HDZ08874.1 class C beta-lactamase-related serine hydrolase [Pseudohongiella sp.]HEA64048.1 class C beta-lactamase-related serine hydrolase [Pseudohongiella sp.]